MSVEKLIEELKTTDDPKIKVLLKKDSEKEVASINSLTETENISGDLAEVVNYLNSEEDSYIFVLGTFRLYREVHYLAQELF
mmetsp:Transcript_16750/g.14678  ORF Transcript_16750/g.14678 Transcript_16750/m.14678 type:complete len:82 (+) Transcript_16750:732-977(+)